MILGYDWNQWPGLEPGRVVEVEDETLRDGLQSPSVVNPDVRIKLRLLHLMEELGIHGADIGLPGAGPKARSDTVRLAREIRDQRLKLEPSCAARTLVVDIEPIVEVSQEVGMNIDANVFLGSSPIRQYAEDWPMDKLLRHTEESVKFATSHGIGCMYVTEDTTRAQPDMLKKLYTVAIENGARRICLADTVGHATPDGVRALVTFIKQEVVKPSGEPVKIDWHGHRDRDLGVINSLAAIEAGADRVHGCAVGMGERVGNTPMELLLVNLKLMGLIHTDLGALRNYCELASTACGVPVPPHWPVVGRSAFRTACEPWADRLAQARLEEEGWLEDRLYSAIPAHWVGAHPQVVVGPMSGDGAAVGWLLRHGHLPTPDRVRRVLEVAAGANHLLTDRQLESLV
ncbi:MAG TPA: 2-isopropylmalate synthase [Candidatus Xenobia bacterium]|jgi:2-isopropylmalate synthase